MKIFLKRRGKSGKIQEIVKKFGSGVETAISEKIRDCR